MPSSPRLPLAAVLLLSTSSLHVFVNPYTKVEESFTIQAVHDILTYGVGKSALSHYDHQLFPGSVPRSFIGPLLLAAFSYPRIALARSIGWCTTLAQVQTLIRWTLSDFYAISLLVFASAIFPKDQSRRSKEETYPVKESKSRSTTTSGVSPSLTSLRGRSNEAVSPTPTVTSNGTITRRGSDPSGDIPFYFFLLLTCVQFHCNFWGGRTVPNSVAFPIVTIALALLTQTCSHARPPSWAQRRSKIALSLLTFSAAVLRLELVGVLAPAALWVLSYQKLPFLDLIATGLQAGALSVLATTLVDTYLWQSTAITKPRSVIGAFTASFTTKGRPLWPELEAILFNVVEGKSSEWGVSPFHAYFSAHLPKLLSFSLPLLLIGVISLLRAGIRQQKTALLIPLPAVHIVTLSLLGHKEWRFIIYCVPLLNSVSTLGALQCLRSRSSALTRLPVVVLALTLASTLLATYISHLNYPGGEALSLLHKTLDTPAGRSQDVNVHIDVLPAMTGVTLFQSIHLSRPSFPSPSSQRWKYDKTENLPAFGTSAGTAWEDYTHLLTDQEDCRVLKRIPNLELLGLPDNVTFTQARQADFRAEPLSDEEQPFRPLTRPVQAYAGLRRKSVGRIVADLKSAIKAPLPFSRLMPLLVPVEIKMQGKVWICVRKQT